MLAQCGPTFSALEHIMKPLLGPLGRDIAINSKHNQMIITNSGGEALKHMYFDPILENLLKKLDLYDGVTEFILVVSAF